MIKAKNAIKAAGDEITKSSEALDSWSSNVDIGKAINQLDELDSIAKKFGISQAEVFDGNIPAAYIDKISILYDYTGRLQNEFGLTADQAVRFLKSYNEFSTSRTPASMDALSRTLGNIRDEGGSVNDKFVELSATVLDNAQKGQQAGDTLNYLKGALQDVAGVAGQSASALQVNAQAIAQMVAASEAQVYAIGKSKGEIS